MEKVLGLDLGTNSIGWAIVQHNDDLSYTLLDKGVNIFQDGVAHDKSGEKPMVTDRTAARASRRHYFRRRLRKIELLKVLVEHKLCPYLSDEDLSDWKKYKRYPLREEFLEWQKTDDILNKNPYHDRFVCLTETLDLSAMPDRYVLGRAFYHMTQRRGFLSNRKESTKDAEGKVKDSIKSLTKAMRDSGCEYIGEYFYKLYESGKKIRKNYTGRLEHYKKEFDAICDRQNLDPSLRKGLERAIFYQRPLKSQKGQVGRCTFEKKKSRCPISHPRYEEFRMWCFINNIKVKTWLDEDYRSLNQLEVEQILPLFLRKTKSQFEFDDIAKKIAGKGNYCDKTDKAEKAYRFNYKRYTSVSGCPVTAGLRNVLGDDWLSHICEVYTLGEGKTEDQILNDVWHVLFSFDDEEMLKEWAVYRLQMSAEDAEVFEKITVPQGYASLSLNAINKMLPYLRKGYRYDEAVILANLPSVMGCDPENLPKEVTENVAIAMEDFASNPLEKKSVYQTVTDYLRDCQNVDCRHIEKLYHPSMIETYQAVMPVDGVYKLGSPRTSAVRNPMAMRALFRLRKLLNELLHDGKIDNETLVRIEFARGLNDSNMRKAIEVHQRIQSKSHEDYVAKIKDHKGEHYIPSEDEILKYQLWEEQRHQCPYTGRQIGLDDFLGAAPKYDIEHTIPRSRGGDNSQMNKTLCESRFNREVKKGFLPSELANHSEIMAIVDSFGWQEEVDSLRKRIERTRGYSATKEEKDRKIQEHHRLKMDLDYWEGKLKRFKMTEVPEGFSNRQGVDIGIIGRYARMYLQTVFRRVSTVKGATTAEFRKMWGLQDYYTKKERKSHSHHCVDAITIACIGRNEYDQWARYMRDEERYRSSEGERPHFPKPWETFTEDVKAVSDTILVPHYTPSNLSKHTKKCLRVRGKLQYGPDGEKLYAQGDTARCSLHQQTFYGAIKRNDEIRYVVRKSLDSLDAKDVGNIVDDVVRQKVEAAIAEKGFKKAVSETIWMNEELQVPIKKVRIYAKSVTNPIELKAHRDKSVHRHKRSLYVANDGNYCMAIYEGNNERGKVIRSYKIVNNIDAVNYYNGKTGDYSLVPQSDTNDIPLKCVIKTGTMVLFYKQSPQELYECEVKELAKRLYKVTKMFKDGRLAFVLHNEARNDGQLREGYKLEYGVDAPKSLTNGYSTIDFVTPYPKLLLSKDNFNMFVEGYDFYITSAGQIKFKH